MRSSRSAASATGRVLLIAGLFATLAAVNVRGVKPGVSLVEVATAAKLLPLVVLSKPTWQTLPLGVTQFQGEYSTETAKVLAFVMLAMLPALVFYAFAERHLISGLTSGGTKG